MTNRRSFLAGALPLAVADKIPGAGRRASDDIVRRCLVLTSDGVEVGPGTPLYNAGVGFYGGWMVWTPDNPHHDPSVDAEHLPTFVVIEASHAGGTPRFHIINELTWYDCVVRRLDNAEVVALLRGRP